MVGASLLTGDGREAREHVGPDTLLEQRGLREPADVLAHLEHSKGTRALGVRASLSYTFAVEMGHLLQEMHVVQRDRAVGTNRQGIALADARCTIARCRTALLGHDSFAFYAEIGLFCWHVGQMPQ